MTQRITVKGMTCGHCVQAVRTELGKIAGVSAVDVELDSGVVTIESAAMIAMTDIATAVDEAGYELA